MSRHIEATFEIGTWDETPFEDGDDAAELTEALVSKRCDGDIKGTSATKWLLAYAPDKTALYVGIEHITGTLSGMTGSLVLLHDGAFRDGIASADLRVASGTDELANAAGTGKFRADPAGTLTLELDGLDTAIAEGSRQSPPGPHRCGVMRIRHLPWSTIARRYSARVRANSNDFRCRVSRVDPQSSDRAGNARGTIS